MKPRTHRRPPAPFEPAEEQIQHAAYYLWEELGRPAGRDLEIWLAAKERLRHGLRRPVPTRRGPANGNRLSEQTVEAILAD